MKTETVTLSDEEMDRLEERVDEFVLMLERDFPDKYGQALLGLVMQELGDYRDL